MDDHQHTIIERFTFQRALCAFFVCLLLATAVAAQTFIVAANSRGRWIDTGLNFVAGENIRLLATGRVYVGLGYSNIGPEGTLRFPVAETYPAETRHRFGLVARLTNSRTNPLDDLHEDWDYGDQHDYCARAGGHLWLIVNDYAPSDNSGSFTVNVSTTACANNAATDAGPVPRRESFPIPPLGLPCRIVRFTGPVIFIRDSRGNPDIYSMNSDGTTQTRLTNSSAWKSRPRLSPDRMRIAFGRSDDGSNSKIYVMNVDGSSETNISSNPFARDSDPAWSPTGRKIAFARTVPDHTGIYLMNPDGSGQIQITSGRDTEPAWSPDGRRIAFASNRDSASYSQIYVMNADGTGIVRLTNSPTTDVEPSWSPDSTRIAFVRFAVGGTGTVVAPAGDIYVMNADGSGVTNLTHNPAYSGNPVWSHDGLKILFASNRDDGHLSLYVMNADGSCPIRLTNTVEAGDSDPDWR